MSDGAPRAPAAPPEAARRVAIVGGGVAGLCAAWHLIELWRARRVYGRDDGKRLRIHLVAPLVPTGGDGSGLGGKAMSRSFEGPTDAYGNDRKPFYGPLMPHKGTVPHGYHVMWAYPNLRRILGDGAPGEAQPPLDGGLLRPKGGAGTLAVFQGLIDDPTPGGPGVALMGLSDPARPETATLPVTQALYRLKDTRFARVFIEPWLALFSSLSDGLDPLFFADLFFAHEVDLEVRLSLIVASLVARTTDPEGTTVMVDGQRRPLWQVEYDRWLELELARWGQPLMGQMDNAPFSKWRDELDARGWILESQLEGEGDGSLVDRAMRFLLPDRAERTWEDVRLLAFDTERVLRAVPKAVENLASGRYRVQGSLHFRFGPDATFTSPYSYDAASAVRSLAFVFTSPESARIWSADGGRMHRVWLRLWTRLQDLTRRTPGVDLVIEPARATGLSADEDGVSLERAPIRGHAFGPKSDLSWPHVPRQTPWKSTDDATEGAHFDVVIPAVAAPNLEALLPLDAPLAHVALAPLRPHHNTTLELVMWTRQRIEYNDFARRGLQNSSITGLEGGWCLLADYSAGLWSDQALAQEDPFGDGDFEGSVLESCGGFDDLFATLDRDDAYGWPAEVKQAVADLLSRQEWFDQEDPRPWTTDPAGWRDRRSAGQWKAEHADKAQSMDDWFLACRWMAWQFVRQLSSIQALGPRAVRQFAGLSALLDPRGRERADLLAPDDRLLDSVRFVVMRNAKPRNRIFSPGVDTWPARHVSGTPLPGMPRVFPAGDWTRNGCDVICMEGATLSAMRAARAAWPVLMDEAVPAGAPGPVAVMPTASWYAGTDPLARGRQDADNARRTLGIVR